jgi:release factor glutamine methyltransferase
MNRREALKLGSKILAENKIDDASLEAEILLRHTLNIDRTRLLVGYDETLSSQQQTDFLNKVARRVEGMPAAYITCMREFYGLEFYVDEHVLIPRPETELLVEKTIEIARNYDSPVIVDVGTGCGNIAVSLAANLPHAHIYATDISEKAVEVARCNCMKHSVKKRIQLLYGDLLEPIKEPADIIVANLPYVRTADLPTVNTNGFEPRIALDGGVDGLDVIRRLCSQVNDKLTLGGTLLLEIGLGQREALVNYLRSLFPESKIETMRDLTAIDRIVCLTGR